MVKSATSKHKITFRVHRPIPVRKLTRFPNLVDFRTHQLSAARKKTHENAWYNPRGDTSLKLIAKACPKLETLMVGYEPMISVATTNRSMIDDVGLLGPKGMHALANGCPKLSMLLFCGAKVVGNPAVDALCHSLHNLKALCLRDNVLISDQALKAIGSSSISTLELVRCGNVTDVGLGFLANGSTSKTLKKLVLENCLKITDAGVELLHNMCSLEQLALSCKIGWQFMTHLADTQGVAITNSPIQTLKELRLRSMDLSDHNMVTLAKNFSKLETLILDSCRVNGAGIRAFSGHKYSKFLSVKYVLENFDPSDVVRLALGCPLLKSVVLHKSLEMKFESMHKNARRIIKFECYSDTLPPFSTT